MNGGAGVVDLFFKAPGFLAAFIFKNSDEPVGSIFDIHPAPQADRNGAGLVLQLAVIVEHADRSAIELKVDVLLRAVLDGVNLEGLGVKPDIIVLSS